MNNHLKNTRIFFIFLFTITLSNNFFGQKCSCETELEFVINYYETNLPGFIDNVSDSNRLEYDNFKKKIQTNVQQAKDKNECFKMLTYYVEFFKDNHSSIQMNVAQVDDKDKKSLKAFYKSDAFKNTETIQLTEDNLKQTELDKITGIYQTSDSMYTVAIVPNKNDLRDYVAVIIESKTPLWIKGQIKFELKQKSENVFDVFMYMRNHSLRFISNVKLNDGILVDDWFKTSLKTRKSFNIEAPKDLQFKELDDSTNYVYIPTFSGNWTAKLDSFYVKYDYALRSKARLIIDVRNNGGGSDENVNPILKYLYTNPFYTDKVELFVTKENIRKSIEWYEENKNDTINFDKEFLLATWEEIETMKKAPLNTFIPRVDRELIQLEEVLTNPKKVAIIVNKRCASSCEDLLFMAKESSKTILVGENSGGYVGYGEITFVPTPCYQFNLGCTMTRYKDQRQYEKLGIAPNFQLDNKSDWIEQTLQLLK